MVLIDHFDHELRNAAHTFLSPRGLCAGGMRLPVALSLASTTQLLTTDGGGECRLSYTGRKLLQLALRSSSVQISCQHSRLKHKLRANREPLPRVHSHLWSDRGAPCVAATEGPSFKMITGHAEYTYNSMWYMWLPAARVLLEVAKEPHASLWIKGEGPVALHRLLD